MAAEYLLEMGTIGNQKTVKTLNFPIKHEFWDQPVTTLISLVNKCNIMWHTSNSMSLCWICNLKLFKMRKKPHVSAVNRSKISTWPNIFGISSKPIDYSKCSTIFIPREYRVDVLSHWYQGYRKVYVLGLYSVYHVVQLDSSTSDTWFCLYH